MVMDNTDYTNGLILNNHQKLTKDLLLQKFSSKILGAIWLKYTTYYESYEKAEQLIKMHCMDRDNLVQDSYRKSFDVKE